MADDAKIDEILDAADAGGAGEGDKPESDAAAASAEGAEGATRDADDTGDSAPAGLKKRLSQVIAQRNAYKEFGDPDALKEKLAKLDRYLAAERELEEQERARQYEEAVKSGAVERAQTFRALADEAYGRGYSERQARLDEMERLTQLRHGQEAMNTMRAQLEQHGLPLDDTMVQRWEKHIETELNADPELNARYWNPATQKNAIEDAFGRVRDSFINPALAIAGAKKLEAYAAKRATTITNGRGPTPTIREDRFKFASKTSDPLKRETELEKWKSASIDAILDEHEAQG